MGKGRMPQRFNEDEMFGLTFVTWLFGLGIFLLTYKHMGEERSFGLATVAAIPTGFLIAALIKLMRRIG